MFNCSIEEILIYRMAAALQSSLSIEEKKNPFAN